jgi:GTPase SAR1 family protein
MYIQQGNSYIVVYSVTDAASFYEAQKIFDEISLATDKDEYPVVLVGNKSDMEDHREVSTAEGKEFAARHKNCVFMEASAKTNTNVENAFQTAVELWVLETTGSVDKDKIPELSTTTTKPNVSKGKTGIFSSITGDHNDVDDELSVVKKQ